MKKEIDLLVEKLNYYTDKYEHSAPEITDAEWDEMYYQLRDMELRENYFPENSPTQKVVYRIVDKLNKVKHNHPMLSLDKTKDISVIDDFIQDKEWICMAKADGLTCSLRYEDGNLVGAETRGDGEVGEDILHNIMVIPSVPKRMPYKNEFIVDGEVVCFKSVFQPWADKYKNPRNFASGSIRLLDAKESKQRGLSFVAWDCIKGLEDKKYLSEKLATLKNMNFQVVPYVASIEDTVESAIEDIKFMSKDMPIDGVVYKFDDCEYYNSLGSTAHHFRGGMAYKFYDDTCETYLRDIEWSMGRTGQLSPVAIFDPVEINSNTISRASLHNISIMKETLDTPFVGQKIEIYLANMIIPQISNGEPYTPDKEVIPIPDLCPICGKEVKISRSNNTDILECINPNCEGKFINILDHFVGKKGFDIKGLSKATLEKLVEWGWVENKIDIFNLSSHRGEWVKKAGFGVKSVDNILAAIDDSKTITLTSFISSLGIPLIGTTVAKELVSHISTYEEFREKIKNGFHFSSYNGFAYSKEKSILNFDYTEADEIYKLLKIDTAENKVENSFQPLKGMTIVITGKLNHYKNRNELVSKIEAAGGKVGSSISGNTSLLINNDKNSGSAKNVEALRRGIPILDEESFSKIYLIS